MSTRISYLYDLSGQLLRKYSRQSIGMSPRELTFLEEEVSNDNLHNSPMTGVLQAVAFVCEDNAESDQQKDTDILLEEKLITSNGKKSCCFHRSNTTSRNNTKSNYFTGHQWFICSVSNSNYILHTVYAKSLTGPAHFLEPCSFLTFSPRNITVVSFLFQNSTMCQTSYNRLLVAVKVVSLTMSQMCCTGSFVFDFEVEYIQDCQDSCVYY